MSSLARRIGRQNQRNRSVKVGRMESGDGHLMTFKPIAGATDLCAAISEATELPICEAAHIDESGDWLVSDDYPNTLALGVVPAPNSRNAGLIVAFHGGGAGTHSFLKWEDGCDLGALMIPDNASPNGWVRLMIQSLPDGLLVADSQGRIWPLRPELFKPDRDKALAWAQEHIDLAPRIMAAMGFQVPDNVKADTQCMGQHEGFNTFADIVEWNMRGRWYLQFSNAVNQLGNGELLPVINAELAAMLTGLAAPA